MCFYQLQIGSANIHLCLSQLMSIALNICQQMSEAVNRYVGNNWKYKNRKQSKMFILFSIHPLFSYLIIFSLLIKHVFLPVVAVLPISCWQTLFVKYLANSICQRKLFYCSVDIASLAAALYFCLLPCSFSTILST